MAQSPALDTLDYIPADICCTSDYELLAPRFIKPETFAYLAGGSGRDTTVTHNRKAFEALTITPKVLSSVANGTLNTALFEEQHDHPFMLAPVAYQALANSDAEIATATASASMNTGMVLSTLSSTRLEKVAQHAGSRRWFQLYIQPSKQDTFSLLDRALEAGYTAIVVTLDTSLQAPSHSAIRSGFKFPDNIRAENLSDMTPSLEPTPGPLSIFKQFMRNTVSTEMLREIINRSTVPVLAKGVMCPIEAQKLRELGFDGVIVSNHGGRSLDGAPASLSVLPQIRSALGEKFPVLLDSGIRSGADIFKAIALGADAVLIGRLQVYALSVAGALGVAHLIKLLKEELEYTMAMAGCANVDDIRSAHIQPFAESFLC